MSFTWIPLYSEIAHKILEFQNRQNELISLIGQMHTDGMKAVAITDRDSSGNVIPLAGIDPFTFFASFNRGILASGRKEILARIKDVWHLAAAVPDDFDGIPIADNKNSWFFAYFAERKSNDIPTLWRAAKEGIEKDWRTFDRTLFDEVLNVKQIGLTKFSVGLFWLNPRGFLPYDKNTRDYFAKRGIVQKGDTASGYFSWVEKAVTNAGGDFPQLSLDAYGAETSPPPAPAPLAPTSPVSTDISHWWLNANPKIWDPRKESVGFVQTYSTHNEHGNKRRIYKYFAEVKPGDLLLGYLTNPDKEIVTICEVTKAMHTAPNGDEVIEFQIVEKFGEPVTLADLQSESELAECEPLKNNQGSLFAVKKEEYETIRAIIDERNLPTSEPDDFTIDDALKDLFMTKDDVAMILARLKRKKAIILQGPPGVGKTFIAHRLAFALMGKRDENRVQMVQFHPSYSYEDFVQGYRPTAKGGLERRNGVFHDFARLARNDPSRDWFFIIDEINRGNLAKIFGELLMLLEADKRGPKHAISLTYSEEKDETFDFPPNLYIIGTMNTADRSLAMVDYALRRRFAFVTLEPAFDSARFADWMKKRGASDNLVSRIRKGVKAVNAKIEEERDLGPGFRIGHSFFCPPETQTPDDAWYCEVVASEIQPLLEEYFDSREDVKKLVADLLA